MAIVVLVFVVYTILPSVLTTTEELHRTTARKPTVLAVFLARNKAHTLPYFLGYFERLRYPKERISIWIHTDHNDDDTESLLEQWKQAVESQYKRVDFISSSDIVYTANGEHNVEWPPERYEHLLQLREQALITARERKVHYVLYIDMDNMIINPHMLSRLIEQNKDIIAPMIEPCCNKSYSNFWCGVDESGFYRRTQEYFPTLLRERKGCFEVPMVHSTFLIDMRSRGAKRLSFIQDSSYDLYFDDLLVFAHQVKQAGMKLFVLNTEVFMQMPLSSEFFSSLEEELHLTENFLTNDLTKFGPVIRSKYLPYDRPTMTDFELDKIYVINMPHQKGRRLRMESVLKDFGIKAEFADTIDERSLTEEHLRDLGVRILHGYPDGVEGRHFGMAEIGHFLNHFKIWVNLMSSSIEKVLVLEDELQFEPNFRQRFFQLLKDVQKSNLDWDLIYLGRKQVGNLPEPRVDGVDMLVRPQNSVLSLAYLLSKNGAKKLVWSRPLSKMIAVGEYLSVMFDQHPRTDWKSQFKGRGLKAFSAQPLLAYPRDDFNHDSMSQVDLGNQESTHVGANRGLRDEL